MQAFTEHEGIVVPLRLDNVDTDQIIPSREMNRISKSGLGDGLFAGWRYRYEGNRRTGLREDFVLNQAAYRGASIMLCGKNFGCGSSREHAVWALSDFGIRAIVAESFGRIFYRNCARNGLLAIELARSEIDRIEQATTPAPQERRLRIDLVDSRLHVPGGSTIGFSVPEADRHLLLNGLDPIAFTLQYADDIVAFNRRDRRHRPWAYLNKADT